MGKVPARRLGALWSSRLSLWSSRLVVDPEGKLKVC